MLTNKQYSSKQYIFNDHVTAAAAAAAAESAYMLISIYADIQTV
jgi:hypothetical protein